MDLYFKYLLISAIVVGALAILLMPLFVIHYKRQQKEAERLIKECAGQLRFSSLNEAIGYHYGAIDKKVHEIAKYIPIDSGLVIYLTDAKLVIGNDNPAMGNVITYGE